MVLPSENLHCALGGGLGGLDLSSAPFICAEARVAIASNVTAIKASFFIIFPSWDLHSASGNQHLAGTPRKLRWSWLHLADRNPFAWDLYRLIASCCSAMNYTDIPVTISAWPCSMKSRTSSNTSNSAWACRGD